MDELYEEYSKIVYHFLRSICRDALLAEELTQETFLQAFLSLERFDGSCKLSVWLCQIARNLYTDLCRERRRFRDGPAEAGDGGIEEGFTDRDTARQLHVLLHALPEPYKEVFSLRTFGELSFAHIGELFQKSESWARVTYFRARQKWKEGLDEL